MTKQRKKACEIWRKWIAAATDGNRHAEALLMGCDFFSRLRAQRIEGCPGSIDHFRILFDMVQEVNATQERLGRLPERLLEIRVGLMNMLFDFARQEFPEEFAIIEKGF